MKRRSRLLAVLTAFILTANLAITGYAKEDLTALAAEGDSSSESVLETDGEASGSVGAQPGDGQKNEDNGQPGEEQAKEVSEPDGETTDIEAPEDSEDTEESLPADSQVQTNGRALTETEVNPGLEASVTSILLEGSTLYTYGIPVVIKKDNTDNKIYIYDGSGTSKLSNTAVTASLKIYGGGKNESVTGNVSITVDQVNIGTIYGGGYSDGTQAADVNGDVSITIKGSANAGNIYGGGNAEAVKGNASACVTGSIAVNIPANPPANHGTILGGGRAYASGVYSACADVGSASVSVYGRSYVVRGGGNASVKSGASGSARADVKGAVRIQMDQVDVREIYGAGNADGIGASAKVDSVNIQVNGNEAMMIQGGGSASSGACADVAGKVTIDVRNCFNLYGYLYGGGRAYGGGNANAGSVDISVSDSSTPVEEQFGSWVAHASYGGGNASGSGSHADITGPIRMNISGGEIAGNIYGGGDAASGGSACAGKIEVVLDEISGYFCEEMENGGTQCYPTVFASGSTDNSVGSSVEPESIKVTASRITAENLWGGAVDSDGNPSASQCASELVLKGSEVTDTVTCFDSISLDQKLTITAFLGKEEGEPTQLIDQGVKAGEILVSCADKDSEEDWFALKEGELSYAVTDTASEWKIQRVPGPDQDIAVNKGNENEEMTVAVGNSVKLADLLMTAQDKEDILNGHTIGFVLNTERTELLDDKVKQAVEGAMTEKQVLAASLDINLYKVRNGAESELTETAVPLELTIQVPQEHKNKDSQKERHFSVIRIHEQASGVLEAEVLEDQDNREDTVTVESDKFSVYALVYADQAKTSSDGGGGDESGNDGSKTPGADANTQDGKEVDNGSGSDSNAEKTLPQSRGDGSPGTVTPKTGDSSPVYGYGALALCALAVCVLLFRRKRME